MKLKTSLSKLELTGSNLSFKNIQISTETGI